MEYMRFLEDSKNLISTGNNTVRIDNIDDIVKSYTDIYEYNYNETSFIKMMKALFGMLLKMSKQADSGLFEDRNILMADIIGIYKKHMPFDVNTYSYFYGGATTGMSFDVLDSILEDAAEATITLYRHISKKYRYSWEECLDNRGFMGQMLYFLYYRMNKQDIKMLKLMSKTIQDNARKKYGTFIDMKADISPKAFISNNCDIRKAKVGDDVFMANCMLNDNSEIKNGCTIDALYTTVEAGVIVKPETVIKGEIFVHIKKDA